MQWKKSSYSGGAGGNCAEAGVWRKPAASAILHCAEVKTLSTRQGGVEELLAAGAREQALRHHKVLATIAAGAELHLLRDSKDPTGPALVFTPAEWQAFTAGVKAGEFDPAPQPA